VTSDRMPSEFDDTAIAVIGMAGRFPGARNVNEFWLNLRNGVESVSILSAQEAAAAGAGVSATLLNDPNYVVAEGLLEDIDKFDAAFFGFNPREAEILDPQHRFLLECAWEALEDAGYNSETYQKLIGLYAGVSSPTYLFDNLGTNPELFQSVGLGPIMLANSGDFLTTRVSYKLNLKGPSYVIQSACSTSLVAVHVACQSILSGECDIALAGGVSINSNQGRGYFYREGGIASKDGHTRAFDADASGTIGGNGVGLVVLKQLATALADGDHISAVIKGSSINNDGFAKIGYTAPSVEGEARAIGEALSISGVDPETITYIEAHGTATPLGDPIEIEALTKVFGSRTRKKNFCGLGSVKTNIGHLDAAAGVAGLIKTILALKHKAIPPSLNFQTPNPKIDLESSPFYVNTSLRVWESNGTPRRAGVSSFGVGGTNAHVILEEAPVREPTMASTPYHLLTLSGKTTAALEMTTRNLVAYLKANGDVNLADLAYVYHVGRKHFNHRRAVVCRNVEEAIENLEGRGSNRVLNGSCEGGKSPVIFMFPGQGAQYVNMARALYEFVPAFNEPLNACLQFLAPVLGLDLRRIIFPSPEAAGDAERQLEQTSNTQIALFVIEYALAKMLQEWGIKPAAMIGHSIGEYVAACLAGVFSLEDGLRLVAARGRLMGKIERGAMCSIPLSAAEVSAMLGPKLSLASINSATLCVASGPLAEIVELEKRLLQKEIPFRRLHTSHAFHSAMVEPVVKPFLEVLRRVTLNSPRMPYVSNLTGTWISAAEATAPHYWIKHLRQTVQFAAGLTELCQTTDAVLLEVGPGRVLSSLVKQNGHGAAASKAFSCLRHAAEPESDIAVLLQTLAHLWLRGVDVNWRSFYAHERRQRLPLPTYPFERQRFWVEPRPTMAVKKNQLAPAQKQSDISEWFYVPSWKRLPPVPPVSKHDEECLVFAEDDFAPELVRRLMKRKRCVVVAEGERFDKLADQSYRINSRSPGDYELLLTELRSQGFVPRQIVHLWNIVPGRVEQIDTHTLQEASCQGFYSLLFLVQALTSVYPAQAVSLFVVTRGLHEVTGDELLTPERATITGLCKVIPQEHSNIHCRTIDITTAENLTDDLLFEFELPATETTIAYRGTHRWVQIFEPVALTKNADQLSLLKPQGVYLLTGGLGRLGLILAEELARSSKASLILTGRSSFPEQDEWQNWLMTHAEEDRVSIKIRRLKAIEELGAEIMIARADVANEAEMRLVVAHALKRFGRIDGVIHGAGVVGETFLRSIRETNLKECEHSFKAKVNGLVVLEKVLRQVQPDFFLLMSSLAAVLGGLGFAAYAAANSFMDAFALRYSKEKRTRWLSINWDGWQLGEVAKQNNASSQLGITPGAGLEVFRQIFSNSRMTQLVVSTSDLQTRFDRWVKLDALKDLPTHDDAPVPKLYRRPELNNTFVAPVSELQLQLAAIWQSLLGIEQVGIHDNFFELGGHSLLAIQLAARIRQDFHVEIPIRTLFESPTIHALASAVEREQSEPQRMSAPILPIVAHMDKSVDELLREVEQSSEVPQKAQKSKTSSL